MNYRSEVRCDKSTPHPEKTVPNNKTMKLINDLRLQLNAVGASLEDDGYTLHCDAPGGYEWVDNGCTCVCIHYASNAQTWLADALRNDGMRRLHLGLRKVAQADLAEHRHNLGDDSWGAPEGAPEFIQFPRQ